MKHRTRMWILAGVMYAGFTLTLGSLGAISAPGHAWQNYATAALAVGGFFVIAGGLIGLATWAAGGD